MKKFFLLIFSTAFLWGCSTSIVSKEPGEEVSQRQTAAVAVVKADKSPPPKWVLLKSGAFSNGGNFTFRGIGYSKPDTTPEETKLKADDMARDELSSVMGDFAQIISSKIQNLPSKEANELNPLINQLFPTVLLDANVLDHWEYQDENMIFSLVTIDLEVLKEKVDALTETPKEIKENFKKLMESSHLQFSDKLKLAGNLDKENKGLDSKTDRIYLH